MNNRAIVGVVLLVVGTLLLVLGLTASDSAADQITQTFTGHFTDKTTWYIVGGAGAAICGMVMLGVGMRGRTSR